MNGVWNDQLKCHLVSVKSDEDTVAMLLNRSERPKKSDAISFCRSINWYVKYIFCGYPNDEMWAFAYVLEDGRWNLIRPEVTQH